MVFPAIVAGQPVIKTFNVPSKIDSSKGGVTLYEFKTVIDLIMFLGKHDDIFTFSKPELNRFITQNEKAK